MKNVVKMLPLALAAAFLFSGVSVNAEVNATEMNQDASQLKLDDGTSDDWGWGGWGGYGLGLGYGGYGGWGGWGGYGLGCCGGYGYGYGLYY